jgi:hypothetical protein
MEPIGCRETSVRNYHYLLRNDPEERSSEWEEKYIKYTESGVIYTYIYVCVCVCVCACVCVSV